MSCICLLQALHFRPGVQSERNNSKHQYPNHQPSCSALCSFSLDQKNQELSLQAFWTCFYVSVVKLPPKFAAQMYLWSVFIDLNAASLAWIRRQSSGFNFKFYMSNREESKRAACILHHCLDFTVLFWKSLWFNPGGQLSTTQLLTHSP